MKVMKWFNKLEGKYKVLSVLVMIFLLFLFVISIVSIAKGDQYISPEVKSDSFEEGELVPLYSNRVISDDSSVPYKFFSLPVCPPEEDKLKVESLGEVILGDRMKKTQYELKMLKNTTCNQLCKTTTKPLEFRFLKKMVEGKFMVEWFVDELPVACKYEQDDINRTSVYLLNFPLGDEVVGEDETEFIYYNHVNIKIHYSVEKNTFTKVNENKIVFFEVEPVSINYNVDEDITKQCNSKMPDLVLTDDDDSKTLVYTYSVSWIESDTDYAHRWTRIFLIEETEKVHWFSIVNSLLIIIFLTGMTAVVMTRNVRRDFDRYNDERPYDDETGWKQIYGDVFRKPSLPLLLSSFVGSGAQVIAMATVAMVFSLLGFLSPAKRGSLVTAMIIVYVWVGLIAGYFSTRANKMMGINEWEYSRRNTIVTALLFPGVIFLIVFILNLVLWGAASTSALPIGTMLALVGLWLGISVPLNFVGSYLATKKELPPPPMETSPFPRLIPELDWYLKPIPSILIGGVLPFGAVFIELYFILTSIWQHSYYYMFGFLFLTFFTSLFVNAEIAIVMTYFQLCAEDYNWWWRSFLTSGATGFYTFLYCIFYLFTKLHYIDFMSSFLYIGYSLILSMIVFVFCGTIGFFSTYYFIVKLYNSVPLK